MDNIKVKVYAKVNLALEITGINQRSYHTLDMLNVSVDISDQLTVKLSDKICVKMDGKAVGIENTAYKTAMIIFEKTNRALDVDIKKGIPVGAGLGGSSADSSAVFYCAIKIGLMDEKTALALCPLVGSDVAYMLNGGYCRLQGEGEIITPLGQKELTLAIVQKEQGASTKDVYKGYDNSPSHGAGIDSVVCGANYYNCLTNSAITGCPSIKNTIDRLYNLYGNATMTGSGSAVFSVIQNDTDSLIFEKEFADCVFARIVKTVPRGIITIK